MALQRLPLDVAETAVRPGGATFLIVRILSHICCRGT